jgi:hypothetical protein
LNSNQVQTLNNFLYMKQNTRALINTTENLCNDMNASDKIIYTFNQFLRFLCFTKNRVLQHPCPALAAEVLAWRG